MNGKKFIESITERLKKKEIGITSNNIIKEIQSLGTHEINNLIMRIK